MAAVDLDQRLQVAQEVVRYAQEIQELLSGGSHEEAGKTEETVVKIRDKIDKAKLNLQRTLEGVQAKKQLTQAETAKEYAEIMSTDPLAQDFHVDLSGLQHEIADIQKQTKAKEKHCQKLAAEQRRLVFHRKQRKLQKRVVPLQFDLSSTDTHVKGYLKKPSGALQTFEFDFNEDSPCYVSDFLWDSI